MELRSTLCGRGEPSGARGRLPRAAHFAQIGRPLVLQSIQSWIEAGDAGLKLGFGIEATKGRDIKINQ